MEIAFENRQEATLKSTTSSRRNSGRRRVSEEDSSSFVIGSDDKELKEAKRRAAIEIQLQNRRESLNNNNNNNNNRLDRESEQLLFELSSHPFVIGQSEEKLREEKRRAAREVLEESSLLLLNKMSRNVIDKERDQKKFEEAEYKCIGGVGEQTGNKHSKMIFANNNGNFEEFSNLMGMNENCREKYNSNIVEDKYAKQSEYRRLLDQQRMKSKELSHLDSLKYGY